MVACMQAATTSGLERASLWATTALAADIVLFNHAAAQAGQLYGALDIRINVFQSK